MTSTEETSARDVPTVGDYRLLTRIGEGGMGVVHLARREGGPRVALKVLRPQVVGDDEARRRLAREVASLQRVRSPWVAEVVDADPWAPVPYVATRYVPGLSLHDHVHEEGPVTGEDLLWFAAGLAEGIASVHAAGVLHRDVKPSNVLMEGRTPILIDFGLARVADDPRLTHTGWLLGTPGYLAPEILYGDDATAASDVHSWAATVAFAATGRAPFGRGPSMAIMDRVRRGEQDLSGIPAPLVHLLDQALDPEPERRPTLAAILGWLRPQVRPGGSAPALPEAPTSSPELPPQTQPQTPPQTRVARRRPGMTMPYAAAPPALDGTLDAAPWTDPRTDPWTEARPTASETRVERAGPDPHAAQWAAEGWHPSTEYGPDPLPERLRRAVLETVLALGAGGLVARWPWYGAAVLVLLTFALRGGSMAASRAGDRRRLRGRRWYDGVQLALSAPWTLVRSLPTTVLLVLWSAGLAIAAALLCYAFTAGEAVTLFVCGTVFAASVWSGPGGSRVRSPVTRAVRPLARSWKVWLPVAFVLLLVALTLGGLAQSRGPAWSPGQDRPLSGRAAGPVAPLVAGWRA